MTNPRLYHYSEEPFVFDPSRVYPQDDVPMFKPRGLWLSVETDDEDSFGWRDWCDRENFRRHALTHRTELTLLPDVHVLHIDRSSALLDFTRRYRTTVEEELSYRMIDWTAVTRDYAGLIIAPYDWDLRLDHRTTWYYAWDCASACIWECSVLQQEVNAS